MLVPLRSVTGAGLIHVALYQIHHRYCSFHNTVEVYLIHKSLAVDKPFGKLQCPQS